MSEKFKNIVDRNYSKLADDLISWIKAKITEAGADGAVIGLSGGIDSSVTSLLCKKAFPENTLGLVMPCGSNPQDQKDAEKHAEKFSIEYKVVDLNNMYQEFINTINNVEDKINLNQKIKKNKKIDSTLKMALANVKPRLRMTTLYYYAALNNYLVIGTDNRSELKLGYFTKFGDGGIDLAPIGNLVKTEVRALARELDIDEEIITKAPSAGLWEDQKDEKELGISYEEIDKYILTGEAPQDIKKKIDIVSEQNAHKLQLPNIPDF
jgi:NAD+ synthase